MLTQPYAPVATRPRDARMAASDDLFGRVATRVNAVLKSADRWPAEELRGLLDCLRREVLSKVGEDERFLVRGGPEPGAAQLNRDHVRLRVGIETLERAAAGEGPGSVEQLHTIVRDMLSQLRRHLETEQQVMATLRHH